MRIPHAYAGGRGDQWRATKSAPQARFSPAPLPPYLVVPITTLLTEAGIIMHEELRCRAARGVDR